VITIGTDGVWEMPNEKGEQFGKQRLRAAIKSAAAGTAEEIVQAILEMLTAFRGDCRPVDDVTFVVIKMVAGQVSGSGGEQRGKKEFSKGEQP
jgi:sigma-B regulation protein RsbU (phosphoserine phosphatase)